MDQIVIRNLRVYGYHGYTPEEKALGQIFEIDLHLTLDLQPAGKSDSIDSTVDYSKVCSMVKQFVEDHVYHLLEALAENICKLIFEAFSLVHEVSIHIRKPQAPINACFDFVGVVLYRKRYG